MELSPGEYRRRFAVALHNGGQDVRCHPERARWSRSPKLLFSFMLVQDDRHALELAEAAVGEANAKLTAAATTGRLG